MPKNYIISRNYDYYIENDGRIKPMEHKRNRTDRLINAEMIKYFKECVKRATEMAEEIIKDLENENGKYDLTEEILNKGDVKYGIAKLRFMIEYYNNL